MISFLIYLSKRFFFVNVVMKFDFIAKKSENVIRLIKNCDKTIQYNKVFMRTICYRTEGT